MALEGKTDLGVTAEDEQELAEGEEEVETTEEETSGTEEEGEEETLSADEQKEAKTLYKLLKDKSTQKSTLQLLAQRAGLLEAETPAEVKQAKKDLKALVKEKLGPEYEFLSGKLGEVMEAVLENERTDINERLNASTQKEVERETSTALERLARETKGESKKLEDRMIQLMDRIKPSDNLSVYEYLKDLYTLASSGKSTARAANQIADKIRRNAGNAAERLHSKGSGTEGKSQGPEKRGLRASIEYAVRQMEKT